MWQKRRRHVALMRLIRQQPESNQAELARLLQREGFPATQASVSRDARELGLVKLDGRYVPARRLGPRPRALPALPESELITSVEPIGANLIVVRTRIGAASTVAVELDRQKLPEIAGTIAGDDTVFIAVRSRSAQGRVVAYLKERIPVETAG